MPTKKIPTTKKNTKKKAVKKVAKVTKTAQVKKKSNIITNTKKPAINKVVTGPVISLKINKTQVDILGTAHISQESIDDVKNYITKIKPDIVAVELCDARYTSITDVNRWKKLDIFEIIKAKKHFLLMSSLILSAFQKKMGDKNNIKPGQEMITAIDIAKEKNIAIALVDRDIQTTLKRAWQNVGMFTKTMLISEMITSLLVPIKVSTEEIEKMKQRDVLDQVFDNLPGRFAKVKNIIITERDKYLAEKIYQTGVDNPTAKKIFAVVGAGHLPGIEKYFGKNVDLKELEYVEPKSKIIGFLKFIAPILIIMSLVWYYTDSTEQAKKFLQAWIIIKASLAGLAALILWAHPLSILAAAITSPISNFNPILKPGWVAALIEARFHKPKVEDFERIAEDSTSIKGFFKNKVIHIFLVLMLPQLASSFATFLFLTYVVTS